MHWQIATAVRDNNASDNSAFTFNACRQEGKGTQVTKKVTCKTCKPLTVQPRTPEQVSNLLYQTALTETTEEVWVKIACNSCECDTIDTQEFTYEPQWVSIGRIVHLLGHVAFDHMMGSEVRVIRESAPFTVYELNFALGKQAGTQHEAAFRERNGWEQPVKELA